MGRITVSMEFPGEGSRISEDGILELGLQVQQVLSLEVRKERSGDGGERAVLNQKVEEIILPPRRERWNKL